MEREILENVQVGKGFLRTVYESGKSYNKCRACSEHGHNALTCKWNKIEVIKRETIEELGSEGEFYKYTIVTMEVNHVKVYFIPNIWDSHK